MKTCAHCETQFQPVRPMQAVCSPLCASRLVRTQKAEQKARKSLDRAMDRKTREAQKTIPQLIKEAQIAFNAFIRERDRQAGHPCISSGRPLDWSGNRVDAGHYRSTGAASHLRFNEDNCHAQSKHDNQHLAGNAIDYRIRLVERIGLARVEVLEADNTPQKWDRATLRQIKAIYREKKRQLLKERT